MSNCRCQDAPGTHHGCGSSKPLSMPSASNSMGLSLSSRVLAAQASPEGAIARQRHNEPIRKHVVLWLTTSPELFVNRVRVAAVPRNAGGEEARRAAQPAPGQPRDR